jgi:hypothetical protein
MTAVLNILAVFMLVAHASLGCCCWHAAPEHVAAAPTAQTHTHCSHAEHSAPAELPADHSNHDTPCDCELMADAVTVPVRVSVSDSFDIASWAFLLEPCQAVPSLALSHPRQAHPSIPPASPVRLHLLHQVLLT